MQELQALEVKLLDSFEHSLKLNESLTQQILTLEMKLNNSIQEIWSQSGDEDSFIPGTDCNNSSPAVQSEFELQLFGISENTYTFSLYFRLHVQLGEYVYEKRIDMVITGLSYCPLILLFALKLLHPFGILSTLSIATGTHYTRWGSSSCPNITGTELIYSGRAGGSFFEVSGGGANYLCMPEDPDYTLQFIAGVQGHAHVYGVEYESPMNEMHDYDAPCAVCHVTARDTVLMIPAKVSCPSSWTREHYDYLMTDASIHHRTMFVCVDGDQEIIPGSEVDTNGSLF